MRLAVGFDDLEGLFQTKRFYGSIFFAGAPPVARRCRRYLECSLTDKSECHVYLNCYSALAIFGTQFSGWLYNILGKDEQSSLV